MEFAWSLEEEEGMEKRETGKGDSAHASSTIQLQCTYGKFRAAARLLSSLHEYQSIITKQGSSYIVGLLIIKRRKEIHQVRLLLGFLRFLFLLFTCLQ